ncbi:Aste57867_24790 [Aphanomyces stellatus]|uniref:Aste57867_24790 protein n=1 Tax=Aphanomyces stellatus TaxID=120398 RepID=A0A485LRC9_9STRA|nr:hypothetical protein As57867_024712 [Aphanomyces stellatus]VFU01425.1 Aste57867_24790 [Aphanomyces stellatus]
MMLQCRLNFTPAISSWGAIARFKLKRCWSSSCDKETSALHKGLAFEAQVARVMQEYNCLLVSTSISVDGGLDHHGTWNLPDTNVRIVTQCKNESKPTGVTYLREFEGVLASQPQNVVGIFASASGYSIYAKRFFSQMKNPAIRLTIVDDHIIEFGFEVTTAHTLSKTSPSPVMTTDTAFHMINSPSTVVDEMLRGLVHASPHLCLVPQHRVVLHRDYKIIQQSQVSLLSGGGSGHEPAHAGYIGDGMLTGVVCGDVFASPNTKQVLAAIRLAAGPHGCLVIVKNYTGDRLNFGLAIENAKAEGIKVDMVVIGDDLAIPGAKAGKRGLAGTVFVHKIAGAMAAQGYPLEKIVEQVQALAIGTMGVAWKSCTLPGQQTSRRLNSHEMELGLGIHGEPGVRTTAQKSSRGTVSELLQTVQSGLNANSGDAVVLMVNNLGSTTPMELNVVSNDARKYCHDLGLVVERLMVGSYMTALDMTGFSLTLLKLNSENVHALLAWLDYPVAAPAWPARLGRVVDDNIIDVNETFPSEVSVSSSSSLRPSAQLLKQVIAAAAHRIMEAEPDLTAWDTKVGDGDCGYTLHAGAKAIQDELANYPLNIPSKTLHALAGTIGNAIGGTSGVLYTIFFTAAGTTMSLFDHGEEIDSVPITAWVESLESGIAAIQKYGGASEGSRTMLDALLPALRAAKKVGLPHSAWLESVATSAFDGADATKHISPLDAFGRTSYIGAQFVENIPDPGAMAVALWVEAIEKVLQTSSK